MSQRVPEFHNAIIDRDIKTVKRLLDAGVSVEKKWRRLTPLCYAVDENAHDVAVLLIERGADPLFREPYGGETLLHLAAKRGNLPLTKFFHEIGIDVSDRAKDGSTALFCACDAVPPNAEVVAYLLSKGARPNVKLRRSLTTPLIEAARVGAIDVVRLLLSSGSNPSARNKDGETAVDSALLNGYTRVAELIRSWPTGKGRKGAVRPSSRSG